MKFIAHYEVHNEGKILHKRDYEADYAPTMHNELHNELVTVNPLDSITITTFSYFPLPYSRGP